MDEPAIDEEEIQFGAVEYTVFSTVLILSMGIGIFYGCFGSKQKTTEEFLMANRKMSPFPVALSLVCSFVSAITLLGNPVEVYLFGVQCGLIFFAIVPMSLTVSWFYLPVFFNLQVSSAYEYLELRFSRRTRVTVSILSTFQMIVYMAIVVYGPSLALEQVTGISTRVTTGAIFVVCIIYSSLGGLKAVLWTDVLQAVIMLGSLAVVVIKGIVDVGGLDIVWQRAEKSDRLEFFNFDPDPRTRHTFWTATVGGFLMWLPMQTATQQQIQRYLSLPTLAKARRALHLSMMGLMIITILWLLAGLVIYAKYFDCDPIKSKVVTSSDQLLPQFVMETSAGITGLPGLFVAGICCASLSSVSSGLNAIASIITFDYMKRLAPHWTDERLSTVSKFVSLIFGAISFGLVFIVESAGSIVPMAAALFAVIVGPTLGIFTLGMFFPFVNTVGALLGMGSSIFVTLLLSIGTFLANSDHRLPDQTFFLSTVGCSSVNRTNLMTGEEKGQDYPPMDWKKWAENDDLVIKILSISFNWNSALAVLLTIIFGLVFSVLAGILFKIKKPVPTNLISPPMLRFWTKLCPTHLTRWAIVVDDP